MIRRHLWALVLDDDHWSTDSTTVGSNIDGAVMVVNVDAHELAESTSPAETPEIVDEAIRKAGEADDCSVDIHYEGV